MALIILPVCQDLEDKITALSDFADLLDSLPERNLPSDLTSIILATILSSARTITNSIPENCINRPLLSAFQKFYSSSHSTTKPKSCQHNFSISTPFGRNL